MGRSKFPGKPSKHVNRQRVNVLACPQNRETNKQVVIAENIFIGLNTSNLDTKTEQVAEVQSEEQQIQTKSKLKKPTVHQRKRRLTAAKKLDVNVPIRRSQIRHRTRSELLARRSRSADSINLGGKFILPQRSAHSSRVIKPNKRFVESENESIIRKTSHDHSNGSDGNVVQAQSETDIQQTCDVKSARVCSPVNSEYIIPITPTPTQPQPNKLILRKAKLQLHPNNNSPTHNYRPNDGQGPFSMSTVDSTNGITVSPGTVTCGVCGAVRFYRFVKQARKFSIYSCESCRKFISKMIKRHACNKNGTTTLAKLVCHKGQGVCHVPPIVRSQQWNLIRCAYKARCPACWLKMCLRSFKMPPKLRSNLAEMLPTNMQSIENLAMDTTLSAFGWKKIITTPSPSFESLHERLYVTEDQSKRATPPFLRTRKKEIFKDTTSSTVNTADKLLLRQKLSLKGPRVKHVCRSASIVLGQTPALFQNNSTENDGDTSVPTNSEQSIPDNDLSQDCDDCHHNMITKSSGTSNSSGGGNSSSNDSEIEDLKPSSATSSIDNYHSSFQLTSKFQQVCSEPVYDALEVRQHGFGLVMSRGVIPKQVCFLCGSAGQEQLIHCAVCCEPYHDYCVGSDAASAAIGSWICSKCVIVCSGCSSSASRTTPCLLCRKLFHTTCLGMGNALCSSCLKCMDCGVESVDKIVGNLVYCATCFCSKYKDHRCPHCNMGFDSKNKSEVILCSECKCVWHTDCDNLNNEQLIMLRTLSLSDIYTCHKCLLTSDINNCDTTRTQSLSSRVVTTTWRDKLCAHFVVGCLAVLRSLAELRVSQRHNKSTRNNTPSNTSSKSPDEPSSITDKDCVALTAATTTRNYSFGDQTDSVPDYIKQKFFLRDCSVAIRSLKVKTDDVTNSALCSTTTDAGSDTYCDVTLLLANKCNCTETLTLLEVKRKVVSKDYLSLSEFRHDLDLAIRGSGWNEVFNLVDDMFYKEFPWCTLAPKSIYLPSCTEFNNQKPTMITDCTTCYKQIKQSACNGETSTSVVAFTTPDRNTVEDDLEEIYDSRTCVLCLCHGDKSDIEGGRLLYCESNTCIHVACALWSVGVHETLDGALLGVAATVRRARLARCVYCKLRGATIDCSDSNCKATYHFPCAQKSGCLFVKNYRVFCVEHSEIHSSRHYQEEDFQIRRSVYVHMDLKKQIVSESHSKWQFVVGSLVIRNFGSYFPILSDIDDVIVPSGMGCTKFFWSTVDPWRIVQYNVTTFISSDEDDVFCGNENNISVDHSELPESVEQKLLLIKKLFNESESESESESDSDSESCDNDQQQQLIDSSICRDVMNYLLDTVCSVEEEELPQNATDILPPEIKDAIFEDLPHDVLDGISMQDIFPKLMSYDDLINETFSNKSELKDPEEEIQQPRFKRKSEPNWASRSLDDATPHPYATVTTMKMNRGLKRSKSDVLPSNSFHPSVSNSHQRSCSLTWSCKLNNNSTIKKRKISCVTGVESNVLMVDTFQNPQDSRIPDMFRRRILQVDGTNDGDDSESEEDEIQNTNIIWNFETLVPTDDHASSVDEPVRCQRCQCTYRTPDSYSRHLQACENMSTSDSDDTDDSQIIDSKKMASTILNVKHQNIYSNITITSSTTTSVLPQQNGNQQPISSIESHHQHNTFPQSQTAMNSSATGVDYKFINQNQYPLINDIIFQANHQTSTPSHINTNHIYTSHQQPQNITFTTPIHDNRLPPIIQPTTTQSYTTNLNNQYSTSLLDNNMITFQTTPQMFDFQHRNNEINTPKYIIDTSSQTTHDHQHQFTNQIQNCLPRLDNNNMVILQSTSNSQNDGLNQIITQQPLLKKKSPIIQSVPIPNSPKKVRSRSVRRSSISQKQIRIDTNEPQIQFTTIPQQTNTVMVQQTTPLFQQTKQLFVHPLTTTDLNGFTTTDIIKPNVINTNQNIQYILTTPHHNIVTTPQSNTFQLPQINPDVMIATTASVPTMVGTIIQPQSFEILQHSNVEQIMFTPHCSTPVQPTPQPMMYVSGLNTNQPVFYGLETVVQNTVMSQQFMSKVSLPGLLAQNSYHTATTQVFQTSTIEPVIPTEIPSTPSTNCMVMQQIPQLVQRNNNTGILQPSSVPQQTTIFNPNHQVSHIPIITNTSALTPQQTHHHHITLPIASIQNTNHKIPTNVVPPTPQVKIISSTAIKPTRPMNRVLPMAVTKPVNKTTLNTQQSSTNNIINIQNEIRRPTILNEMKSTIHCDKNQLIDKKLDKKTVDNIITTDKLTVINSTPQQITNNHLQKDKKITTELKNNSNIYKGGGGGGSRIVMGGGSRVGGGGGVDQHNKIRIIEQKTVQMNIENQSQHIGQIQTFHVVSKKQTPLPSSMLIPQIKLKEDGDHSTCKLKSIDFQSKTICGDIQSPPPLVPVTTTTPSTSLKLVFQKQSEEGVYKITNKPINDEKIETKSTPPDVFISVVPNPKIREKKVKKSSRKNIQSTVVPTKKKSKLLFKIQSQDGLSLTCGSLTELWQKVFNLVQESRKRHNMVPLPVDALNGYEALGLKNQSLKCILEEMKKLRLAEKQKECEDHELDLGSDSGAIRCTPFNGIRADHDMFSWLASRHRQLEFPEGCDLNDTISRRASSINLPIAMRYRNLKETSKHCVGVYRSNIHGRGLFCLRDIELGEMVIEYAGEVIRSSMTDIREKYYNSKGIGCYMFRIDDNLVVDATVKGNAARFINHSCDPNCYSRVLDILGHKHILIFALRKIQQGEELTYDYKFPFEEDKIPCTCGARRCRKYLN